MIGDANTVSGILELHSEIQRVLLEEIDDLVERLLAEVLYLENLRFRHLDEIAKRADARVLERVHRADRKLEVVDRGAKIAGKTLRISTGDLGAIRPCRSAWRAGESARRAAH